MKVFDERDFSQSRKSSTPDLVCRPNREALKSPSNLKYERAYVNACYQPVWLRINCAMDIWDSAAPRRNYKLLAHDDVIVLTREGSRTRGRLRMTDSPWYGYYLINYFIRWLSKRTLIHIHGESLIENVNECCSWDWQSWAMPTMKGMQIGSVFVWQQVKDCCQMFICQLKVVRLHKSINIAIEGSNVGRQWDRQIHIIVLSSLCPSKMHDRNDWNIPYEWNFAN